VLLMVVVQCGRQVVALLLMVMHGRGLLLLLLWLGGVNGGVVVGVGEWGEVGVFLKQSFGRHCCRVCHVVLPGQRAV
jgi:hypothetical protein